MKQRISIICTILMMVLLVVGCGPTQTGTTGTTHQVTDGAGVAVTVPNEPKRIVPVAASTEDFTNISIFCLFTVADLLQAVFV